MSIFQIDMIRRHDYYKDQLFGSSVAAKSLGSLIAAILASACSRENATRGICSSADDLAVRIRDSCNQVVIALDRNRKAMDGLTAAIRESGGSDE